MKILLSELSPEIHDSKPNLRCKLSANYALGLMGRVLEIEKLGHPSASGPNLRELLQG